MARFLGVDLPNHKKANLGLTYIFGIGRRNVFDLLDGAKVDPNKKIGDLTEEELSRLRRDIEEKYMVEGDLRSQVGMNIKRLVDINCYRGIRHRMGLPLNGQRTRTNARTRKGKAKSIAGKKKPGKK